MQLSLDHVLRNDKIFFIEYIICEFGRPDDGPPLRDRFFKKIPNWGSAPDIQNKIRLRLHSDQYAFYKEVHPFFLFRDPCGDWLKWESLPNSGENDVKALTPINKNCNPFGPQPRGIYNYLDPENLTDLLSEYGFKLQNIPGGVVSMEDFKILLRSLMGYPVSQSVDPSLLFSSMAI